MANLQRAVASIKISGETLDPILISALLGAAPSRAQSKGELLNFQSGRTRNAKFGLWLLKASETEPGDVDAQVTELLEKLTQDISIWRAISVQFDVELFCGWFMAKSNEGIWISAKTLLALGERGIEIGVDLYGPDADA